MTAQTRKNFGAWAATGATLTAILSSACCWLPLLLLAFGASATGLSAAFEAYRTPLLLVTALFLATGFHLVYFRKPSCEPGGACAVPNSKLTRLNKGMLWVATLLVAAFAFFPNYVGALVGAGQSASVEGTAVRLDIQGMTCEACALHIEKELRSVPGVLAADVSYDEHRATITVDRASPPAEADLVRAVERAGYKAAGIHGPADASAFQPKPRSSQ
jgi:copper chaperone CopZ